MVLRKSPSAGLGGRSLAWDHGVLINRVTLLKEPGLMSQDSLPSAHGAIWSHSDLRPIMESMKCKQTFEERGLTDFSDINFLLF